MIPAGRRERRPSIAELRPAATPWYGLGFVVNPGESWGHGGMSHGMDVAAHHYSKSDTTFICIAAREMVCNRLIYGWYPRTFGQGD